MHMDVQLAANRQGRAYSAVASGLGVFNRPILLPLTFRAYSEICVSFAKGDDDRRDEIMHTFCSLSLTVSILLFF